METAQPEANPRAAMGGNNPPEDRPLAERMGEHWTEAAIRERHKPLKADVDKAVATALEIKVLETPEQEAAAAKVVLDLKAAIKRVDDAHADEKAPALAAGRVCDAFKKWLDDTKALGCATNQKVRLEKMIGALAAKRAEENRVKAAAAAAEAAAESKRRADEAAELEAQGMTKLAGTIMGEAIKEEKSAGRLERLAGGSATELARQEVAEGVTTGLRFSWAFTITDPAALKATLGPLRDSFTLDAIHAAIRKFAAVARQEERTPELAGVTFEREYTGNVRG